MMGDERPSNVFDAAMSLFVKRYELTVHQRLTRALSMSGLAADEKPSQWMARFRHAGGEWDRECRAMGSSTPLTIVITNNPRTPYATTINGRAVAKGRRIVRHATLRDCFSHPGNSNRTSGGRQLGRPPGRKCIVQETWRTWYQWRQQEETTAMLVPWQIRRCV